MRFDYQPPLVEIRLLKTNRQRRMFLFASMSLLGFIIAFYSAKYTASTRQFTENSSNEQLYVAKADSIAEQQELDDIPKEQLAKAEVAWKSAVVQKGDTISRILHRFGISSSTVGTLLSHPSSRELTKIRPGQVINLLFDDYNLLKSLKLQITPGKLLHIQNTGAGYKFFHEEKQITKKHKFASNRIGSSFYNAAQKAGLNDRLIMEMADIFAWDIDFVTGMRPNDSFRVIFEEEFAEDEKVATGNILVAEFTNQGKVYQAVRFTDSSKHVGYYSPEGFSLQKTFLRNPVKFTRISSKFTQGRHHPILHQMRAHKGVDFVAPYGTPIKAAGDGKIVFIGNRGGYGYAVELQHGSRYSTLYAHLSKFAANLTKGDIVKQGQVIGYVGKTGLATGAHLHYEFRIDGIHRDPLTVQLPKTNPIRMEHKEEFLVYSHDMLGLLNKHDHIQLGKN